MRKALPQPLLEIERQLVHGKALNCLHSGTSGPILSDEIQMCTSLPPENIARAEIPIQGVGEAKFETICQESIE